MTTDTVDVGALEPGRLYSSIEACDFAGITYRQLDYWVRTGRFTPQISARGSGSQRKFSAGDVRNLIFAAALVNLGAHAYAVHQATLAYKSIGSPPGTFLVDHTGHVQDLDEAMPMAGWVVVVE